MMNMPRNTQNRARSVLHGIVSRSIVPLWIIPLWLPAVHLSVLCLPSSAAAADKKLDLPQHTTVWTAGKEGYHTYRIPAVIVTKAGTVLAICEGRKTSSGDHGDIDLVLKRSTDNGKTWGPNELIYEEGGTKKVTIGNPCPVVDEPSGTIWLPFCRDNDRVFITHSTDDGKTWAEPREITATVKKPDWGWYATGPGVGIQIKHGPHKGRLVIPCDHREKIDGKDTMFSHVFTSDDHGKTWTLGGSVEKHTDECQVVELADGKGTLMINMRNYWGRTGKRKDRAARRAVAVSPDGGTTWTDLRFDETLIEPICQASFLRYSWPTGGDKSRLLFSNPANKKGRDKMTVRLSYDEGKTWPVSRRLWKRPAAYSCLTVLPDKSIGCLYERGNKSAYETITFARFPLSWLEE